MRFMLGFAALAVFPLVAHPAGPGKFNKVLAIGDKAPEWKDLEGIDGKKHSFTDLEKDFVVVMFTCNSCVVAEAYEERIIAFTDKFAQPASKLAFVAINVNTAKEDALPAMKERAAKKKFNFPYLYDPTQEIARKYGAMFTPEFFVLNKDRNVIYMGAMDDKAPPGQAKLFHLDSAVTAALAGKPAPTAETSAAAGCRIKFNPKKDD